MGVSPWALEVVHADADLLVINKPAGLLSVPGRGADKQDCASTRAQSRYADALVVHRLDMGTSGLMIMARNRHTQRALSTAFADRMVDKRYVAVVDGAMAAGGEVWNVIDLPIRVDWPNRPLRVVDPVNGKASQTRWRPLPGLQTAAGGNDFDRSTPFTRLLLAPVTGRSHQLRVHLAALGHPILGDALYASPTVQERARRLLLHASFLEFVHPKTGQTLEFSLPVPF